MAACRIIHLYAEGTFCHAYEVSAWLCHKHISQFRVTHRHVKGIEQTIAFIGFPMLSLKKRTPEGAQIEEWKTAQPLAEQKETSEKVKHAANVSGSATAFPTRRSVRCLPPTSATASFITFIMITRTSCSSAPLSATATLASRPAHRQPHEPALQQCLSR